MNEVYSITILTYKSTVYRVTPSDSVRYNIHYLTLIHLYGCTIHLHVISRISPCKRLLRFVNELINSPNLYLFTKFSQYDYGVRLTFPTDFYFLYVPLYIKLNLKKNVLKKLISIYGRISIRLSRWAFFSLYMPYCDYCNIPLNVYNIYIYKSTGFNLKCVPHFLKCSKTLKKNKSIRNKHMDSLFKKKNFKKNAAKLFL